jgi:hypothetical protein
VHEHLSLDAPAYCFCVDRLLVIALHELAGNTLLEPIFKGITSTRRGAHILGCRSDGRN